MKFEKDQESGKDKVWRRLILNVSLVIILLFTSILIGFVYRTNKIMDQQLLMTAKAHFNSIVLTRKWNASHGGVYIKKEKDTISNPYLKNPDIVTLEGDIYTLKNPALMTREISEYAEKEGYFKYHITSLKPLNPDNSADNFEKIALLSFEKGISEHYFLNRDTNTVKYRYMGPLIVEEKCMICHAEQGYAVGDIRGGISVSFDITEISKRMVFNQFLFISLSLIVSIIFLYIIINLITKVAKKLIGAYKVIEKMSVTDELTQLYNRRYFYERLDSEIERALRYKHSMSLLMLDIDYFKKVNDTYGHQTGDDVLVSIAASLKSSARVSDIVARYGGEELIIVLPETDEIKAGIVAEKLRTNVGNLEFISKGDKKFNVTVSIGVSSLKMIDDQKSKDVKKDLIKLADTALYTAKDSGRNKVVLFEYLKNTKPFLL